jgi:hypothetical protein
LFFFEKKNQKTFGLRRVGAGGVTHQETKVFCFFSSEKKTLFHGAAYAGDHILGVFPHQLRPCNLIKNPQPAAGNATFRLPAL